MARSVPWRRQCNDLVFWRQTQAQNATIYILRETGPTGFLLKEEGETKPCKAFLGDPHSCTCSQFMKDRDLCKHICWLLLKKFRVPQTNPMSWQKGLVEREINEILRGLTQQQRKKVPTAVTRWRRPLSADSNGRDVIPQRDIADDDVCPICQDELLLKRLPVTYCKYGCGNSIHIKCMKVWAEHQKSQGEVNVKCPFCREDFGPFEMLKYENRNAEGGIQGGRMDRHLGTTCQSCRTSPIEGKCYRCSTCVDFHLCQACFNTPIHTQHAFQYRHKRNQRWRAAGRAYGAVLPQAVVDDLVNRDISENDYDLLTQLDSTQAGPIGSDIPEEVVQGFPLEKVRPNGPLLAPGVQCRVCLHAYQVGQTVRKLPRCKHKFHQACIDNWLLHSRPTCPVDGQVVWDRVTAQMEQETNNANRRKKRASTQEPSVQGASTVQLEIPGMGLTLRTQEPAETRGQTEVGSRGPRGKPPLRRGRDRADAEAERVLGSLQQANLSLNGLAVQSDSEYGAHQGSLPGGRLLNRLGNRRTTLENRLVTMDTNHYEDEQINGLTSARIGQENRDPLDEVVAANNGNETSTYNHEQSSPQAHSNHYVSHPRPPNHSSLFGQQAPPHNATAHLLSNAERLAQYQDIPNIFADATTASGQVMVETICSDDMNYEGQGHYHQGQGHVNGNNGHRGEGHAATATQVSNQHLTAAFGDIPPESRLFADDSGSASNNQHLQFQRPPVGHHGNQGRLHQGSSSAPASVNGERGRAPQRGRGRGGVSVAGHPRSNSRDRGRDLSRERMQPLASGVPIPKEGENLLERLSMFTDLYLGNSPRSHPAVTGMNSLPPRPQRRPMGNHAAVRRRRFENERRRTNLQLEGNAYSDNEVTLRDIIR